MLLTLIASLCVLQTIFPHGRPKIPRSNSLQGENSSPDMTLLDAFMKLYHDACTLVLVLTGEDKVCVAMSKQLPIYHDIPA